MGMEVKEKGFHLSQLIPLAVVLVSPRIFGGGRSSVKEGLPHSMVRTPKLILYLLDP